MKLFVAVFGMLLSVFVFGQTDSSDLIQSFENKSKWTLNNRTYSTIMIEQGKIDQIMFDAKPGDGLAIYQDLEFENGIIEFDLKGKDVLQRSFVGVAFHIQDENTFNAIYFRPFNFKKPERASHSVQYICHPEFTWQKLRTNFPEQFENHVTPVPNPEEWFHAKITVKWPDVRVYVDYSNEPSLDVKMKGTYKKGKIGLWVGNGSDGAFRNLAVTKE